MPPPISNTIFALPLGLGWGNGRVGILGLRAWEGACGLGWGSGCVAGALGVEAWVGALGVEGVEFDLQLQIIKGGGPPPPLDLQLQIISDSGPGFPGYRSFASP